MMQSRRLLLEIPLLCFRNVSRVRGLCGCRPSQADYCIAATLAHAHAVALLTTVSKLHIAYGVVRVSARMVGILLNSCSQRQNSNDLHLSLRFVLSERRRREFE